MYNASKYFMIASAVFSLLCALGAIWAGYKLGNDTTCYIMSAIFIVAFVWLVTGIKKLSNNE